MPFGWFLNVKRKIKHLYIVNQLLGMDQGRDSSCCIPIVHQGKGPLPTCADWQWRSALEDRVPPVALGEVGLSRGRKRDNMWFMHGILPVYLP